MSALRIYPGSLQTFEQGALMATLYKFKLPHEKKGFMLIALRYLHIFLIKKIVKKIIT